MTKPNLTVERLRELLDYDPVTGILMWRCRRGPKANVGVAAGIFSAGGVRVGIDQRDYLAHRLSWLHFYGAWPERFIDHIDGNPRNNAIANLRDVTRSVNEQNRHGANRNSSTGLLGIWPDKINDGFVASIMTNRKKVVIGRYTTAEEAHAAYIETKRIVHEGCMI